MLDDRRNAKLVDFGAAREGAHVMLHSVQVSYLLTPRPHLNPNPNQAILIQHPDPNPN